MGVYYCKDGTKVILNMSEDGSKFTIDESTSQEDRAKFWETFNEVEAKQHCSKGIALIAAERQRQINELGYTVDHDQEWVENELAIAAACYAVEGTEAEVIEKDMLAKIDAWPFGGKYDKRQEHDELQRQIIAGALIAAEIDRLLDRGGSDK